MFKRIISVFPILSVLLLSGCWNYRGLNNLGIISGFAIDMENITGDYLLTFEMVDLNSPMPEGIETEIIESRGKTVFEAVRNAKKNLEDKLYFGHCQTLILSKYVTENIDLSSLLDWVARDIEPRENISVIVSRENTAGDVLKTKGLTNPMLAYELNKTIEDDNAITASTISTPLHIISEKLQSEGVSVVMPAVKITKTPKGETAEINGIAMFNGERFSGFLTPDESKYYLFAFFCFFSLISAAIQMMAGSKI
jgi:spore germination protein KC